MALSGLQGLDSKQPSARALIDALAIVMEKSEVMRFDIVYNDIKE